MNDTDAVLWPLMWAVQTVAKIVLGTARSAAEQLSPLSLTDHSSECTC